MKITISGTPGSGKSTVAEEVAKRLNLRHLSSGEFMRNLAKEKKVTPLELARLAEQDEEIDKKVDRWTEAVGEAEDNFVIDSRLAFNFIHESIKIFLSVSDDEAARRIYKDLRPEEKENATQGATFEAMKSRKESEKKRFKEFYGLDYEDHANYDIVIDTTKLTIEQVITRIIEYVRKREG